MQFLKLAPLFALVAFTTASSINQATTYDPCVLVTTSVTALNLKPLTRANDLFVQDDFFQEFFLQTNSGSEYKAQVIYGPNGRDLSMQHRRTEDNGRHDPKRVLFRFYTKAQDAYIWLDRNSQCRGQLDFDYKDIVQVEAFREGGPDDPKRD
ncbi:hypothetical protein CBS101457_005316 [Exobasidium rhododendri]|nr:hypothetical protein CBS101457_005316 [Exobasidium rhododendri]